MKRVLHCVQDCMSTGKPLLIENIEEELDPVLDPVLERRVIRKGRTLIIALADKEVRSIAIFNQVQTDCGDLTGIFI